ncbi:hypothetical protein LTR93_011899 [Exophiala xenobiotica]|nr:hypothetical protein LTR93_011899 [Exophiala xenobiotica]
MSTDLIEKDKAMDTPIDRAASGIVLNKDGIKDIEATWTRQSQVGQSARLRSSCLSEALQREPGTKQMVDRKIVRQQMLDELDDRTKKDILTDKHSGKPRVVEGGLYLTSTLVTPKEEAKLRRIASTRTIHPEKLQHIPEHTW